MSRDIPILFQPTMARANMAGTKHQTRRLRGLAALNAPGVEATRITFIGDAQWSCDLNGEHGVQHIFRCPYGESGDLLWQRETWYCDDFRVQKGPYLKPPGLDVDEARRDGMLVYGADGLRPYEAEQPVWKPSIHMPRWACRFTARIMEVRIERLHDISEADVLAEGIFRWPLGFGVHEGDPSKKRTRTFDRAQDAYRFLWEATNGPNSWAANPFVWVIAYERIKP